MATIWARLFRRSPRQRRLLSPIAELRSELGQILGHFSLGATDVPSRDLGRGNVVVYGLPPRANAWPAVTAAHEQTHFRLTNSTPFGLFLKQVAGGSLAGREALVDAILGAQWRTQEAAATYIGLATAAQNEHRLDKLVSLLPSADLGQSPYREAYDSIAVAFPLYGASDGVQVSARAMVVEALATWALCGDALERFKTPAALTEDSLRRYLAEHGPDRRLAAMLDRLRPASDRQELLRHVQSTIRRVAEAAGGYPDDEFWALVDRLQGCLPLASNSDLAKRLETMGRFQLAWSSSSPQEAEQAWTEDRAASPSATAPEALPEVIVGGQHLVPYTPGMIDLGRGSTLDLGHSLQQLRDPARGRRALLVAVLLQRGRLHFRPTVYPAAEDGVNPSHPDSALIHLMQSSGPIHACDPDDFAAAMTGLPVAVSALVFLGHSWSHWHIRQHPAGRPIAVDELGPPWNDGFEDAVRLCIEADLSEPHLLFLMAGAGLHPEPECFLIEIEDDQSVACILDRKKPGIYLLQLVSGELGFEIFDKIARRRQMRMLEVAGGGVDLPHLPLLQFVAKSMVIEALSQTSSGPFLL